MVSVLELYCLQLSAVQMFIESEKSSRIGIVGAGMAGLGAYRILKLAGFKDLTILEARSRIGGRVHSIEVDDGLKIDLGASWLHGRGPGACGLEHWTG